MENILFALNLLIVIGFCRFALKKDNEDRSSDSEPSDRKRPNNKKNSHA